MIAYMTAKGTSEPPPTRYRNAGGVSRTDFVAFQTDVPPWVREYFKQAAKERGVSLSLLLEEIARNELATTKTKEPDTNSP